MLNAGITWACQSELLSFDQSYSFDELWPVGDLAWEEWVLLQPGKNFFYPLRRLPTIIKDLLRLW